MKTLQVQDRPFFFASNEEWLEYYMTVHDCRRIEKMIRVVCPTKAIELIIRFQEEELLESFRLSDFEQEEIERFARLSQRNNFVPFFKKLKKEKIMLPIVEELAYLSKMSYQANLFKTLIDFEGCNLFLLIALHLQDEKQIEHLLYDHLFFEKFFHVKRGPRALRVPFNPLKHPSIKPNQNVFIFSLLLYHDIKVIDHARVTVKVKRTLAFTKQSPQLRLNPRKHLRKENQNEGPDGDQTP